MPFRSKAQQRAAFAGVIPGFDKERAREWASGTEFGNLPERAKNAGRHHAAVLQPGVLKDALIAIRAELEARDQTKSASLIHAPRVTAPALRGTKPPIATSGFRGTVTGRNAAQAAQNGRFKGFSTSGGTTPVATSSMNISAQPKTPSATASLTSGTTRRS
jgi:hypothetical protein